MSKNNKFIIWVSLLIILLVVTAVILGVSIVKTNPTRLGPAGVTFWFINLLFMLVSAFTLAILALRLRKKAHKGGKQQALRGSFRTGFLLAFCSTILLALSSLRSLSWRDIILFLLTVVLIEVYFRTRKVER